MLPAGWSEDELEIPSLVFHTVMYEKKQGMFHGTDKQYLNQLLKEQEDFINEDDPIKLQSICEKISEIIHVVRDKLFRLPVGTSVSVVSSIYMATLFREIASVQRRLSGRKKNRRVNYARERSLQRIHAGEERYKRDVDLTKDSDD